jgi:hypothetical protein
MVYYVVLTIMDLTEFESGAMAKEFYGLCEFVGVALYFILYKLKLETYGPVFLLGYFGVYLTMLNLGHRQLLPDWLFMNDAAKH